MVGQSHSYQTRVELDDEANVGGDVYGLAAILWGIYHELSFVHVTDPPLELVDLQSLLHLTALISCREPISSLETSRKRLVPLLAEIFLLSVHNLKFLENSPHWAVAKADTDWPSTKFVLASAIWDWPRHLHIFPFPTEVDVERIHGIRLKCTCSPRRCRFQSHNVNEDTSHVYYLGPQRWSR